METDIAALTVQFNEMLVDTTAEEIYTDPVLGRHCKAALHADVVVANVGDPEVICVAEEKLIFFWLAVLITSCKKAGVSVVLEADPVDKTSDNNMQEMLTSALSNFSMSVKDSNLHMSFAKSWNKLRRQDVVLLLRPVIGCGLIVELRKITQRRGNILHTRHATAWAHTEGDMQRPVDVSLLTHRLNCALR